MSGFLANAESLRLVMFGGKGGTGKTTAAAATAIHLSRQMRRKILLVSTDPAHSLADSLGMPVADDPVAVPGAGNLWARQLDAPKADRRFHERYDKFMKILIDRGTFLDSQDARNIVDLPLPGLDEVMAIREISNLLKEQVYDLIIMDTAPTGHTLRLLELPEVMTQWIRVYSLMQRKHKYMQRRFTGRCTPDEVDAFLKTLSADVRRVRELLHTSASAEFVPVINPDPLSVAETRRLVDTLARTRIAVRNLIVNRVPADRDCPLCRARRAEAMVWLRRIDREFDSLNLVRVPLSANQALGLEMLEQFGEALFSADAAGTPPESAAALRGPQAAELVERAEKVEQVRRHRRRRLAKLLRRGCRFIMFGGKGGVGKTSLAAATALRIAQQRPRDRVLILSIDPAHSLSDCVACPIGNEAVRVDALGMLDAKELDAEDLFDTYRDEYRRDVARAFDSVGPNIELKFEREVMDELLSLWPAGLDEMMALIEVVDQADAYDVVVLDTSPTGHLVRFLEMPDLAREWINALLRIILKHQAVINLAAFGEKLVRLSRDIRRVRTSLTDANKTEFVAVTIPETMAIAETARLLASLKRLDVACRDLVINMVTPPQASCPFCGPRRRQERRCVREAARLENVAITEVPMLTNDIRGTGALGELADAALGPVGAGARVRRLLRLSPQKVRPAQAAHAGKR